MKRLIKYLIIFTGLLIVISLSFADDEEVKF
jgi:hypothetical protein